jgi:hypothetical protein
MSITVFDLSTTTPEPCATFWDVSPEYAVAYCYAESCGRLSELYSLSYNGSMAFTGKFSLTYGEHTVSCGDFAADTGERHEN